MKSLANLLKRDEEAIAHQTMPRIKKDIDYLSHSHTETLSGSSTTSIVNKCYGKSWKEGNHYRNSEYDSEEDEFERGHDTLGYNENDSSAVGKYQ